MKKRTSEFATRGALALVLLLALPSMTFAGFLRGDSNDDGVVSPLLDSVHMLVVAFDGGTFACEDAVDADDNGVISPIVDALYLLLYGFFDGPAPAAPGTLVRGNDPTDDTLSCHSGYSWLAPEDIAALSDTGLAWDNVVEWSDEAILEVNICDQNDADDIRALSRALVGIRNDDADKIAEARTALIDVIGTEDNLDCTPLGPARQLGTWILVAELVGFETAADETLFRDWVVEMLTFDVTTWTVTSIHEVRPNNWGTHAGFSRTVAALYLNDHDEYLAARDVFRGWLGERDVYSDFDYGNTCWQSAPLEPVGINPVGATLLIEGELRSVDGALPEEMRRVTGVDDSSAGCPPTYPFAAEPYAWEALQGAVALAAVLDRQGEDVWEWSDQALLRATEWLVNEAGYDPSGDDEWILHMINHAYGTDYTSELPATPGKGFGFTDWVCE